MIILTKIKKTKNGTRDERVIQWRQKKNKNVTKMRQKRDKNGDKVETKWRQSGDKNSIKNISLNLYDFPSI